MLRVARRPVRDRAALPARARGRAGPLDHPPALRHAPGLPRSPRRCCSASAACARCAALHLPVEPLPLQRGPRRLRGHRADRRPHGGGRDLRDGLAGGARAHRLHHPHAGARRQRGAPARRAAPARRELRAGGQRDARDRRRPVQHDGGGAAPGARRQRRRRSSTARRRAPCGRTWTAPRRSSRSPTACTSAPGRTRAFRGARGRRQPPARAHRPSSASCWPRWGRAPASRLDPDALTIGFARRAATYKRPDLILRDPDRLAPLLKERRLQLIFSGKAHPADHAGKAVIALLIETIRQWPEQHRLPRRTTTWRWAALLTRGRGRVAQHAAPAAGGQRHLGHEGGHERHAQPLRARRLVAGGLPSTASTGWAIGDGSEGPDQDHRDLARALRRPSRTRCSRPSPTRRAGRG